MFNNGANNIITHARNRVTEMLADFSDKKFELIAVRNILEALEQYSAYGYSMTIEQSEEINKIYKEYVGKYNELIEKKESNENKKISNKVEVNKI